MDRESLGLAILDEAEDRPDKTHQDPEIHEGDSANAPEAAEPDRGKVRDDNVGFRGHSGSGTQ
jgi:hypothetical protein